MKFIKTDTAADPMVAHCDCFRFVCSELIVGYTGSAFIVGDEDCWGLRKPREAKTVRSHAAAIILMYIEGSVLGFRNSTTDGRDTAADAM